MCEYKFRTKEKCEEKALPNSKYCILHIDFPEDEEPEEFLRIARLKKEKVNEKMIRGDFNFEGAKLLRVNLSKIEIKQYINFTDAIIRGDARFNGIKTCELVDFNRAKIGGFVWFDEAKIDEGALFNEAKIGEGIEFNRAEVRGFVSFMGAKIEEDVGFEEAKISENAEFEEAEIGGDAYFDKAEIGRDACFDKAKIGGDSGFDQTEIKGRLSFYDTKFRHPEAQEEACRKAKKVLDELGDREGTDYHFYREMEARRKQKNPIIRFLELPIQYIFGYGMYWQRVLATWFLIVFGLSFLYFLGNGVEGANSLWECIYFSIVTATTLGYGDYHPTHGIYQGLASFEAIFGTFMWAAFIAIFARKYMR